MKEQEFKNLNLSIKLLKENLVAPIKRSDRLCCKRVKKCLLWLKDNFELQEPFRSYEEVLYCVLHNDFPDNHYCEKCNCNLELGTLRGGYRSCNHMKQDKSYKSRVEKYGQGNNGKKIKESWSKKSKESIEARSEKIRQTCLKRYGVKNPGQVEFVKQEIKNTCIERYGVECVSQSKEAKEKIKETWKNKPQEEIDAFAAKGIATKIKKYGKGNNHKKISESLRARTKEEIEKTYEKIKQTQLERYGAEWYTQTLAYHKKKYSHFKYREIMFDSRWELAYYIFCIEHNFDIERCPVTLKYEFNGKKCRYVPDFKVNGELVEIKGDHFFNEEDVLINPYDRKQDEEYKAKYQCMIDNDVKILKWSEIKECLEYVQDKYTPQFIELFKTTLPFPYLNEDLKSTTDLELIHHFHKSIYEASIKNHPSPIEAWKDKNLIEKVALNRLKYKGSCRPADILQGFNVMRVAPKVSMFSPSLAQELTEKYLNDYNEVFDPFSGFSGRLLGVTNLNKQYIGQDIHPRHIEESNKIIKYKKLENVAIVKVQDILTDEEHIYESLFTCPPYGGKEHWNKDNDEIEKTCDEWIDICLSKYHCKKYLFVVDETIKYKDKIVETIENKSHFSTNYEYVVLI